ncbi:peroxiredoxin family protein [Chloroflexota bacterium]
MSKARRAAMLLITLASVLVSGLVTSGCSPSPPPSTPSPTEGTEIGNLAPDFQLQSLDGQAFSLSSLRGKAVLLNFWASWCGPCIFEMPFLQEIYEEWPGKGLVLLAINVGESSSQVEKFIQSKGLSLPVLLDTKAEVAHKYNIRFFPTTFFIDKDGIIQEVRIGAFPSKAEIEKGLTKINP